MDRVRETRLADDDPLMYLPRKSVQEFPRRRAIYGLDNPVQHLWVVILGRVKITTTAEDGCETVARLVRAEQLFGEACLIPGPRRAETAVPLDKVTLMSWTRAEVEQQIEREPRLGLALAQYVVRKCIELQDRIESMAVYKTPARVMLSLVQLGNELGTPMPDGALRVGSLTHHTVADYVGTSREIVTFQMNRLRRLGMIQYSRKHIDVYTQLIQDQLRHDNIVLPQAVRMHRAGG